MIFTIGLLCFVASIVSVIIANKTMKQANEFLEDAGKYLAATRELNSQLQKEVRSESAYVAHVDMTLKREMNTVRSEFEGFKRWHYNQLQSKGEEVDASGYDLKPEEKMDEEKVSPMGTIEVEKDEKGNGQAFIR